MFNNRENTEVSFGVYVVFCETQWDAGIIEFHAQTDSFDKVSRSHKRITD